MRDIFEEIFTDQPIDPTEAARRHMRRHLHKRFYKNVEVAEGEGGFAILLDGKTVKTPARRTLSSPARTLSEAIADEWRAQKETIDPAAMPLTRLANSIIDGVADARKEVAAEIVKYLGSDLLFYRADGPEGLIERQTQLWDPVVAWARDSFGAHFLLVQGVTFAAQPQGSLDAIAVAIPADPWRLGAVHSVMTITGSALLALALSQGALTIDAVWQAAQVDEDWNLQTWGRDDSVLAAQANRRADMEAAAQILHLLNEAKL